MTLTGLIRLASVVAALTALGCSDSKPTPAQGASHLALGFSSTSSCPVGNVTAWSIPTDGKTSETVVGAQVANGSGGASVSCSVTASGDGFVVTGSLALGAVNFSVQAGKLGPSSTGPGLEGTATIYHYAAESGSLKGTGCTLTANETQAAQIAPGRVWANFSCDPFVTSAATGTCAANGTFVFGNCAGG